MSTLVMNARITFPTIKGKRNPQLIIRKVAGITVEKSWKDMFGKAEILLPRNTSLVDPQKVNELFKGNPPVIIEFGYNGEYHEEFTGYVIQASAGVPVRLVCHDEMHNVSRIPVNYAASNVTLDKLLKDICKGYTIEALEGVQLGGVRFSNTNVGAVLKKLQDDWNLYSYMDGKRLISGKHYSINSSVPIVKFYMERTLVSEDLNYRNAEDVILKIKATSMLKNGRKIKYEIGEEGGELHNLTYYNIEVQAELEKKVKIDYEARKKSGFDGNITAFGKPRAVVGGKASLVSDIYPDRNGTYYIDGIVKLFEPCHIWQKIKLGSKV